VGWDGWDLLPRLCLAAPDLLASCVRFRAGTADTYGRHACATHHLNRLHMPASCCLQVQLARGQARLQAPLLRRWAALTLLQLLPATSCSVCLQWQPLSFLPAFTLVPPAQSRACILLRFAAGPGGSHPASRTDSGAESDGDKETRAERAAKRAKQRSPGVWRWRCGSCTCSRMPCFKHICTLCCVCLAAACARHCSMLCVAHLRGAARCAALQMTRRWLGSWTRS
jgi:hypothetical protein